MKPRKIATECSIAYGRYLATKERSPGTIEKYLRDVRALARWLDGAPVTK